MTLACFSLSLVFDQLDVVSYEEVVRLPAFKRKTLVLIGIFLLLCYWTRHFCLCSTVCRMYPTSIASLPGGCNLPPCLLPILFLQKKVGGSEEEKEARSVSWASIWSRFKSFLSPYQDSPWFTLLERVNLIRFSATNSFRCFIRLASSRDALGLCLHSPEKDLGLFEMEQVLPVSRAKRFVG